MMMMVRMKMIIDGEDGGGDGQDSDSDYSQADSSEARLTVPGSDTACTRRCLRHSTNVNTFTLPNNSKTLVSISSPFCR